MPFASKTGNISGRIVVTKKSDEEVEGKEKGKIRSKSSDKYGLLKLINSISTEERKFVSFNDLVKEIGIDMDDEEKLLIVKLHLEQLVIKDEIEVKVKKSEGNEKETELFRLKHPFDLSLPMYVVNNFLSIPIPLKRKSEKLKELETKLYGSVNQDATFVDVENNYLNSLKSLEEARREIKEILEEQPSNKKEKFLKEKKTLKTVLPYEVSGESETENEEKLPVQELMEENESLEESSILNLDEKKVEKEFPKKEGKKEKSEKKGKVEFIDESELYSEEKKKKKKKSSEESIQLILEKKFFKNMVKFLSTFTQKCGFVFFEDKLVLSFFGDSGLEYFRATFPKEFFGEKGYKVNLGSHVDCIILTPDISGLLEKLDKMGKNVIVQNDFKHNVLLLYSSGESAGVVKKTQIKQFADDNYSIDESDSKIYHTEEPKIYPRFSINISSEYLRDMLKMFGKVGSEEFIHFYLILINKISKNEENGEQIISRFVIFTNEDGDEYIIDSKSLNGLYYNKYVFKDNQDLRNNKITFLKKINILAKKEEKIENLLSEEEDKEEDKNKIGKDFVDEEINQRGKELLPDDVKNTIEEFRTKNIISNKKSGLIFTRCNYALLDSLSTFFELDENIEISFDAWDIESVQPLEFKIEKLIKRKDETEDGKERKVIIYYFIAPIAEESDTLITEIRRRVLGEEIEYD